MYTTLDETSQAFAEALASLACQDENRRDAPQREHPADAS